MLEWGQRSPHAASFDIDWDLLPHRRDAGVLLPILGRPYGKALENGEIELKYDAETGSFAAWYYEHKLPINPQRYGEMLRTIVAAAGAAEEPAGRALLALADDYRDARHAVLPRGACLQAAAERHRGRAGYDRARAFRLSPATTKPAPPRCIACSSASITASPIGAWRCRRSITAASSTSTISPACSVEKPATFRAAHTLVARLIGKDKLQGLRLDHIDGLRDPVQYTRRLRSSSGRRGGRRRVRAILCRRREDPRRGRAAAAFRRRRRHHRL